MSSAYQVPSPSAPPPKSHAGLIVVILAAVVILGAAAAVLLPKIVNQHATTSGSAATPGGTTSPRTANPSSAAAARKPGKAAHETKGGNVGQGTAANYGQSSAASDRAIDQQELDRLTHQYNLLEGRVAAFDSSLDTMRRAQEQQGVGMRGDMASAQNRLHDNMGRMQTALEQRDLDSANRYLKLCDADAAKLADFLGQ